MLKWSAMLCFVVVATCSQAVTRSKKEATASVDHFSGNTVWGSSLGCESCGSECEPACGTRQFRACCFNYLRRKRGEEDDKIPGNPNYKEESQQIPFYIVERFPNPWMKLITDGDFKPATSKVYSDAATD